MAVFYLVLGFPRTISNSILCKPAAFVQPWDYLSLLLILRLMLKLRALHYTLDTTSQLGKFLLKYASTFSSGIIELFRDIKSNWRFVIKFTPLLTSLIHPLNSALEWVKISDRSPLYETSYAALVFFPLIHICSKFLHYTPNELRLVLPLMVNNLFQQYITVNYPLSTLIFTDGSVSNPSAGYAFHIPRFQLQSSGPLSSVVSSFTAECHAILKAIKCIRSLPSGHYLIILTLSPAFSLLSRYQIQIQKLSR